MLTPALVNRPHVMDTLARNLRRAGAIDPIVVLRDS
jgi:hypothetical protein